MKKLLLTLTAVAGLTMASQAQEYGFGKGNVIVEGGIGFGTSDNKNSEVKENNFRIAPSAAYFLTDKLAVGLGVNYATEKQTDYSVSPETFDKGQSFGVDVFGRYYFLEVGSRFKTYAQVGVGYRNTKTETEADNSEFKTNAFNVNGTVGANFFLTENIAVGYKFADVLGFSTTKADVDGAKAVTSFSGDINNFSNFFNSGSFTLTFKF